MVVFVCNGCGDSLKISQVDAHGHKCKKCESVSCADCNVDFHGDDYKQHKACVTEAEKYSGKDYIPKVKGAKVSADKAELQFNWAKHVVGIIEGETFPSHLQKIGNLFKKGRMMPPQNAQRLKILIKKHLEKEKHRPDEYVEEFLALISKGAPIKVKEDKKRKAEEDGENVAQKRKKRKADETSTDEEQKDPEDPEDPKKWTKRVKKAIKKHRSTCPDDITEYVDKVLKLETIPQNKISFLRQLQNCKNSIKHTVWNFIMSSVASSNDERSAENMDENGIGESVGESEEKPLSKREKKALRRAEQRKKQKKEKKLPSDDMDVDQQEKPNKKKKRKSDGGEDNEDVTKNKKSKKFDDSGIVEGVEDLNVTEEMEDDDESPKKKMNPRKFNWATVIIDKVKNSKKQEMKLASLKKLVFDTIQQTCAVKPADDLHLLFTKALKRCHNLTVKKDRVSLKSGSE